MGSCLDTDIDPNIVPESNVKVSKNKGDIGREIAPNTGANATKFFSLATKS